MTTRRFSCSDKISKFSSGVMSSSHNIQSRFMLAFPVAGFLRALLYVGLPVAATVAAPAHLLFAGQRQRCQNTEPYELTLRLCAACFLIRLRFLWGRSSLISLIKSCTHVHIPRSHLLSH